MWSWQGLGEIRARSLVLTLHPQLPELCTGSPLGQYVLLPCPQHKSPYPLPRQEEEVAGSGLAIGPGAEEGKLPWPLLSGRRQSSLLLPTTREGCGGLWVGMVSVKVGQVPALCWGRRSPRGGQCGKGAVHFYFLHPPFTQIHTYPLGW